MSPLTPRESAEITREMVRRGQTEPGVWYSNGRPLESWEMGQYSFTPNPLTADELRRILRKELERAGNR